MKFCPACGQETAARPSHPAAPPAVPEGPPSQFALALVDESGTEVARYNLSQGDTTIGREGALLVFPDDVFMSPLHVRLTIRGDELVARDLGSRNGTWLFIAEPHLLVDGDRLLIGSQVLEYRRLGYPGPHPPESDATRRMGSLVPSADIACLTQLRSDGSTRDTIHLSPGRNLRLGRDQGDYTFPYDPSMSGAHAEIRSEDADFVAVDLESRNGVGVAARGEAVLAAGSRFLVGDKMLRVESR
jgi:pSer/pThr/pTyr-binding forkhead associated (FHA) protein